MSKAPFGKCLLSNILKESHMSITDLEVKTGISRHQLSKYINDNGYMSLPTARVISKALKRPIDDLYEWYD
jgi:transcriptional regulator with XRE-family HTH domain